MSLTRAILQVVVTDELSTIILTQSIDNLRARRKDIVCLRCYENDSISLIEVFRSEGSYQTKRSKWLS